VEPRFVKNGRVTSQVVSLEALSEIDQQAWRRFLAPRPLAFLSYPYARAVASCVPSVRVCRLMQDGRVAGFFPFQYRSSAHAALGIGQRLAGEMSDYFGLVAEPGFRIAERALLDACGLRSLAFTHLDESQRENGLAGDKSEVGHRIDFPQGGKAFWEEKERQDKKFVSDTERRERKLIREHGALQPPKALRDAHYPGAKKLGHGQGYVYPPNDPAGYDVDYLPEELKGRTYYEPEEGS